MSLIGSFTGSDQRKDINQGFKASNALMKTGYDKANGYYDTAAAGYTPYVESGGAGQNALMNALGLNGAEGSTAAYAAYNDNPAFQAANNYGMDSLAKKYNAGGNVNSGANALAMARAWAENWGGYVDRLANLGNTGLQATGAQSSVRQNQGDTAYGYGATMAGNAINRGNALAQNRSTGINNLLSTVGAAGNAYTAWANPGRRAA